MAPEQKLLNRYYVITILAILVRVVYYVVNGMNEILPFSLASILILAVGLLLSQKRIVTGFFILFGYGIFLIYAFDDGVINNNGFYFYNLPIMLVSLVFANKTGKKIFYLIIPLAIIQFCLINFTDFSPKLYTKFNKVSQGNVLLYINLFVSVLITIYTLWLVISMLIKAESSRGMNEAQLLSLLANNKNPQWSVDTELNLINANEAFYKFYLDIFKREIKIGEYVLKGNNPEEYRFWKLHYDQVLSGKTDSDTRQYDIQQKERIFEFTFNPIRDNKQIIQGINVNSYDISGYKSFENELLERERNLQLVIQSVDELLIEVSENGTVLNFWNKPNALITSNEIVFSKTTLNEIFVPEFRNIVHDHFQKVFVSGESHVMEISHNEEWFQLRFMPFAIEDHKRISIRIENITIRKDQELTTFRSKEFLKTLIENLPVGIFAKDVDNDLRYTLWNHELEKMFGISEHQVLGKTDFDVFNVNDEIDDFADTDTMVIESGEPLLIDNLNVNTYDGKIVARTIKIPLFNEQGKISQIIGILEDITDIKIAQDDLLNAERRWNFALSGSRDGVWDLNLLTREIYYSPTFKRMLGYSEEEFQNSTKFWESLVHPDDINRVVNLFQEHIKGDSEYYQDEYRIKKKDGSYTWVIDRGKIAEYDEFNLPIRFIGTVTDISYLKNLESRSINNERFLENLNQNINEAIYRSTLDKGLIYVNKSFLEMFGFESIEEANQKSVDMLYATPGLRMAMLRMLEIDGQVNNKEVLFKKKNGQLFWGLISTIKTYGNDNQIYFDGAIRDISNIKQIEDQLLKAKEEAEEASKAKGLFLSTMSHEIRTPMNAVIGLTNLLLHENPKDEQLENLQTLKFSAESLMYLLNDILDFSKIEAGKIELENTEFNLAQLLVNIRQTFIVKADEKNIKLSLLLDPLVPQIVIGDPIRIAQIISNLVSNAIKFTEKGEVLISLTVIEQSEHFSKVHFRISDTGIGIPAEKLPYIFEQFMQASSDTTRKFGGTGLGLAITKKLIEIFGSSIEVESEIGEGTTFYFDLQLNLTSDNKSLIEPHKKKVDFEPLSGMRILLVEDNKVNTFVAARFLLNWGVNYEVAENGLEALSLLADNKYDLILMDLQMPVMDGYECTLAIRKKDKVTPIFALTANAFNDVKSRVLSAGMNDYITKPFDPDELYKKIKAYRPDISKIQRKLF